MRRAKHRAGGRRGLVLGSIIVSMLAVGQAGTLIAGAAPSVDSPGPPSTDGGQPTVIVDTEASSDDCGELGFDQSCAIGEIGAEASLPVDTTVTVDEPFCGATVNPADAPASNESTEANESAEATEDVASNEVTNTVECEGPTPPDLQAAETPPDLQVAETSPDLQVSKTSDADGMLHDGDDFLYTITVTNVGDEEATGVELVDVLPPGALDAAPPSPPAAFSGTCIITSSTPPGGVPHAELRCGPVSLDAGESASVTLKVFVNGDVCGSITNVVDVEGANEPEANVGEDNHAEASDEIACVPRIRLLKGGPSFAHVGDSITYVFIARNTGSVDLANIDLSDPKCGSSPTLVDDADGNATLAVDEEWTFECEHTITAADGNVVHNQATVTGDHEDSTVTDTDTHDVDVIHPSIDLEKSASPTSGPAGSLIVYTYTVTNTGDTQLFDIAVSDDQVGPVGEIPTLAPRATAERTFEITLGSSPITTEGTASGADRLGESVSDTDTSTVTVVAGGGGGDGTGSGTAFTGSDTGALAAWVIVLTALGSALLVSSRRRSQAG